MFCELIGRLLIISLSYFFLGLRLEIRTFSVIPLKVPHPLRTFVHCPRRKDNKSEKEKVFEYSGFFLGGGRGVEGKRSSYEFAFADFIFVVGSAAKSVGTTLEFAAFLRGPDAKNIAELVPSGFFSLHKHGFSAVRSHFPRKNTCIFFISIGILSWEKKGIVEIASSTDVSVLGPVELCRSATSTRPAGTTGSQSYSYD